MNLGDLVLITAQHGFQKMELSIITPRNTGMTPNKMKNVYSTNKWDPGFPKVKKDTLFLFPTKSSLWVALSAS